MSAQQQQSKWIFRRELSISTVVAVIAYLIAAIVFAVRVEGRIETVKFILERHEAQNEKQFQRVEDRIDKLYSGEKK